jgi:hypothetical protein
MDVDRGERAIRKFEMVSNCQLLFIFCGGCPDTWSGFSWLAFKDLWPVIKLSLSSGVMIW